VTTPDFLAQAVGGATDAHDDVTNLFEEDQNRIRSARRTGGISD
jgi:hypothetical protein